MLSNETKIGLLTIVAVALLIWGYKYLKGTNLLTSSTLYYVEYDNVDQLSISTPVLVNGFQVGIVSNIYMKPENQKIEVTLEITEDINIPKTTAAQIFSTGFMGGRAVNLDFGGKMCKGANCAQSGDYLQGQTKNLFSSMIGNPQDLSPYMDEVRMNVGGIVDSIKNRVVGPDGETNESVEDVKTILANVKRLTISLDRMMASSTTKIDGLLDDAQVITNNLKSNNSRINSFITNVDELTGKLNSADITGTVDKASTAMDGASDAIKGLETTLASADEAVKDLSVLLKKVNSTEGTMGMLLNDKKLYEDLDRTLTNMDFLLQDLRLHPERYRRILSKKKMPYEAPVDDPALKN